MICLQDEQINDEIEEIRELLYDIVKDFPTGITSTFLEEEYKKRFVHDGLAKPLPANWLNLLRHAEEFQVRDVSMYTLLYLANANIIQQNQWNSNIIGTIKNEVQGVSGSNTDFNGNTLLALSQTQQESSTNIQNNDNAETDLEGRCASSKVEIFAPIARFTIDDFEMVMLNSLPNSGPFEIRIVSAHDPDNIFFRLITWDPYCDYLYAALAKSPPNSNDLLVEPGQILVAKIDGIWERVEILRKSTANPHYWIVYVVDCGYIHAVSRKELRPLTEAMTAFKKVFLAVCKLSGVQNRIDDNKQKETNATKHPNRVCWPPETQHYISEALQPTTLNNKRVELIPTGEWQFLLDKKHTPTCVGRLLIEGIDFAAQLLSMGLAQKK